MTGQQASVVAGSPSINARIDRLPRRGLSPWVRATPVTAYLSACDDSTASRSRSPGLAAVLGGFGSLIPALTGGRLRVVFWFMVVIGVAALVLILPVGHPTAGRSLAELAR